MIRFPWTKRVEEAQQDAAIEEARTEHAKRMVSQAEIQAQRVIIHSEVNGWTRIAKELFAS